VPDNFVSFWALLGVYLLLRTRASWRAKGLAVGCVALAFLSSGRTAPATGLPVHHIVDTLNDPFLALGLAQ
jgi:hypothetical protein